MEDKRNSVTAIDAINKCSDYMYRLDSIAASLSNVGMEVLAEKIWSIMEGISVNLNQARSDISEEINYNYDQAIKGIGDILNACVNSGEKK